MYKRIQLQKYKTAEQKENQDISQDPDKEFTEVNTRKRERKTTPPQDEQQHKNHTPQEGETCPTKETAATHRNDVPTQSLAPKKLTFQTIPNHLANTDRRHTTK